MVAATDLHGGAEAFHQAVTMNAQERADRNTNLLEKVKKEDVLDWLIKQMRDLDEVTRAD